jgi:hypothetical protein
MPLASGRSMYRFTLASPLGSLLALALALDATSARADDLANPDVIKQDDDARRAIDRTWLYADDALIAAPLTVIATTSTSYTDVGSSPFRIAAVTLPTKYTAFDANTAQPGVMFAVGGELGLFSHVSVMAVGELGVDGENGTNGGAVAGLRVQALPSSWRHVHLVLSGGYLRESWEGPVYDDDNGKWNPGNPNGDNGMWFQAAISGDIGRLRLVGNVHGEHVFADGRDPLDVMVNVGASYRLVSSFRLGAEWVGQDLEETFSPGAEGGARMFFGPIASIQFWRNRITLVAGPSIGFSQASGEAPNFIGRIAASYGF